MSVCSEDQVIGRQALLAKFRQPCCTRLGPGATERFRGPHQAQETFGSILVSSETFFIVALRILQVQCSLPKLSACLRDKRAFRKTLCPNAHPMQIPTPNHKRNGVSESSRSGQDSEDTSQPIYDQLWLQRYGSDPEMMLARPKIQRDRRTPCIA
jgi:hypothetical protein